MKAMNSTAVFAKLNLTLDVTGREGEYHLLDSLVLSVDLADRIVAKKRKDKLISVTMKGMGSENILPERNNAVRAGEKFVEAFSTGGADITVYKNIPMGAGLGGSSADAAGVLLAMKKLYRTEGDLSALASSLGSDVLFQLKGGFARMRGRGEKLTFLPPPDLNFLLLVPMSGVSTAECFRMSDRFSVGAPHTERALAELSAGNVGWAAKLFYNDLYPAAKALNGDVERAYMELREFSPLGVSMTGSGSGVFALFETEELCRWAKSRYRGKFRAYVLKTARKTKIKNPFVLQEDEAERS